MKVEQVSFYRKRLFSECGPVPDIRNGIETLFSNTGASDVDAIPWDQLFVARKVDGRNRIFRAVSTAAPSGRKNAERPCQQDTRAMHVASANEFANPRAGNGSSTNPHLRIDNDLES